MKQRLVEQSVVGVAENRAAPGLEDRPDLRTRLVIKPQLPPNGGTVLQFVLRERVAMLAAVDSPGSTCGLARC